MYPHKLNVFSIYKTILGESTETGKSCVIVRLAGCSVGCIYCDTKYAANPDSGTKILIEQVIEKIRLVGVGCSLILITGGEPLEQKDAVMALIKDTDIRVDFDVMIETSGTYALDPKDFEMVTIVMDIKCPSSGIQQKNELRNIYNLTSVDEIKFVIQDRVDYDFMTKILKDYEEVLLAKILVSPVYNKLELKTLAKWIMDDNLDVRLQVQLHKIIWPDTKKEI